MRTYEVEFLHKPADSLQVVDHAKLVLKRHLNRTRTLFKALSIEGFLDQFSSFGIRKRPLFTGFFGLDVVVVA